MKTLNPPKVKVQKPSSYLKPLSVATGGVHPLVAGSMKKVKGATLPQQRAAMAGQIGGAPAPAAFAGRTSGAGLTTGSIPGLKRGNMSKTEQGATRRVTGRRVPRG